MNFLNLKRLATTGLIVTTALLCTAGQAYAQDMSMRVFNRSSDDVVAIRVSPTYSRVDGRHDLLGAAILRAGYNMTLDFDTPDADGNCLLDIKAEASSGSVWRKRIDVCTQTRWNLFD